MADTSAAGPVAFGLVTERGETLAWYRSSPCRCDVDQLLSSLMQTTSFLLQFQERATGASAPGNVKTKTDAREDDDVARDLRSQLKTFTKSREEPDQDASLRLAPETPRKADTRETRGLRSRVKTFTESREEPDQDVSLRLAGDLGTKTATRESNDLMRALDLLTRTETKTREESDQDATSPSYFTFPRA